MQYPLQKEGIVFNFICLYLWGKKNPNKHKTPKKDIKIPGINTLFKGTIQGSIFYFVIWKKVGLKAIRTTCSRSKKALPIISLGKSDPDLGKRPYHFSLSLSWCSVWSSVQCKFQIQRNCVSVKSNDLWKCMLSQQSSEAQKYIQS